MGRIQKNRKAKVFSVRLIFDVYLFKGEIFTFAHFKARFKNSSIYSNFISVYFVLKVFFQCSTRAN